MMSERLLAKVVGRDVEMSLNVERIVGMDVGDDMAGFIRVGLGAGIHVGIKISVPGGRVGPAACSTRDSSSGASGHLRPSKSCARSPRVARRLILVGMYVSTMAACKRIRKDFPIAVLERHRLDTDFCALHLQNRTA